MGVYLAYALLVAHVALGALQDERSPLAAGALGLGRRDDRRAASRRRLARAAARPRARDARRRRLRRGLRRRRDRREAREGGHARRRARGGLPLRRPGLGALERLPAPERPARRGEDPRRLRHLPLARLPVPAGHGRVAAALHREGADLPGAASPGAGSSSIRGRCPREPSSSRRASPPRSPRREAAAATSRSSSSATCRCRPGLSSFLFRASIALAALAVLVALALAAAQQPLGSGEYEFGVDRTLEGALRLQPVPSLWTVPEAGTRRPVRPAGRAPGRRRQARPRGRGRRARRPEVRLTGRWIRRAGVELFEISRGEALGAEAGRGAGATPLGRVRLAGEIVDSKCWLGVMKPAEGKSHKDCAIRCISGGAPAALVARDGRGGAAVLLLVGEDGRPLGPRAARRRRRAGRGRGRGDPGGQSRAVRHFARPGP